MNLVELAQRIKNLRLDRRLTIEGVAARAGLTRSWLSKVENFRVTPSLPSLAKIAAALGVTVSELVVGLDERPKLVVVRRNERQILERNDSSETGAVYESLAFKRASRVMDPFVITLPAGYARDEALSHEGEEFLLVQTGQVLFEYEGESTPLEAGDSLYFDASVPHRLINNGGKSATVLCVFSEVAGA